MPDVDSMTFSLAEQVKMSAFARGVTLSPAAAAQLSRGGTVPLSLHEYATTGGITVVVDRDVYINAPFDDWYCNDPEVILEVDPGEASFVVFFHDQRLPARVVPLPGYLGTRDAKGRLVTDVAMSHGDRLRLSPIAGCSLDCAFCDMAQMRYIRRSSEQLIAAIEVARADTDVPVRHILISGGTPSPSHFDYYDRVCLDVVAAAGGMPVDVMMVPRLKTGWIDRLVDGGVHGFSINLEIADDAAAGSITRLKHRIGRDLLARNIDRALQLTGGRGRVRSLIVVGLEPIDSVLEGVEFISQLGCDPVLSPFRPAAGTRLASLLPPSVDYEARLYAQAFAIARRHGVSLGPRCIPCQHNTLTFPDSSGSYYYSDTADRISVQ
jgi:hypothetical protein